MKRLIPTLVILCLAISMHGQIERDKVLHFVGGNLFGLAGAGIAKNATDGNRVWTFVGAVAGSALAGVTKEAIDSSQPGNQWDNSDVLATVLGGITVGLAIEIFSKKKEDGRLRHSKGAIVAGESYILHNIPFSEKGLDGKLPSLTPFGFSSQVLDDLAISTP